MKKDKCNFAVKLGYLEVIFLMLWFLCRFGGPTINSQTDIERASSLITFFLLIAFVMILEKAFKKGFYFGFLLDFVFIGAGVWNFYVSSHTLIPVMALVSLICGLALDLYRTALNKGTSSGLSWFDDICV